MKFRVTSASTFLKDLKSGKYGEVEINTLEEMLEYVIAQGEKIVIEEPQITTPWTITIYGDCLE